MPKAKYKGSRFFFPAMTRREDLPFHHAALAQVSSKSSASGNTIDHLPAEVLHLIYEYLLKDPRDLVNLAQVSRRFLSAVMKPVQLNEHQEWFPFLQSVFEEMLFNHRKRLLEQNKITEKVFLQALKPHENEMDHAIKKELLLSLSLEEISRGAAHLNRLDFHQAEHDKYRKWERMMNSPLHNVVIGVVALIGGIIITIPLMIPTLSVSVSIALFIGLFVLGLALVGFSTYKLLTHVDKKVTSEANEVRDIRARNPFPNMMNSINERESVSLDEDEDDESLMERRAVQA